MTYHYDEAEARAITDKDELLVYCLPLVKAYIHTHRWILKYEFDDVHQELALALHHYLRTYDPTKNVKLLTWIYSNLRFACLSYNKKHHTYLENTVQFAELDQNPTHPEELED